jgi:hypothetical protein
LSYERGKILTLLSILLRKGDQCQDQVAGASSLRLDTTFTTRNPRLEALSRQMEIYLQSEIESVKRQLVSERSLRDSIV